MSIVPVNSETYRFWLAKCWFHDRMTKNVSEHNGFSSSLLLQIFKLKIKFSFYDLPCSFPIKHSVLFSFFFSFLSLFKSPVPFVRAQTITLPLVSSSLFYFVHPFADRNFFFFFSRAHKCSNSWCCHSKIKKQNNNMYMFDWPKFLGANHICNYEIKDKQRDTKCIQ